MVDPASSQNRGYAFLTYTTKQSAKRCVDQYHGYQIRGNKSLTVLYSRPNARLFISPIPKYKSKEEIYQEFSKLTDGLTDVIVYPESDSKDKIRGFAFLEYNNHETATYARRKLITSIISLWGKVLNVEWAEAPKEPDSNVMAKVY